MADKIDKTVAKILGLKENVAPAELSPNALDLNEIDKDIYHDLVDRYDAMRDNLEDGLKEYAPFDYLSEDIFNSLFKYNAKLKDEEDVKPFSKFNHKLMDEMMTSEQYEKLRESTKFDMMGSAIGTEVMQQKAMEKIMHFKNQLQKQKETGQQQPGADAGQLIEQLNQMAQQQQKMDDFANGCGGFQGMTPAEAQKYAKMQEELQKMQKEADANQKGQKQLENGLKQAMNNASKSAFDQVTEMQEAIDAWGLDPGDSSRKISLDKRKKAIERIRRSTRLRKLTDLVGRFKRIAMQKKKQKVPDGHSVKSVEIGNNLEKLLPSELMKLSHPVMKKEFMQKYTQKQLLQYEKEDILTKGQGPIIVLHDKSSSMSESGGIKDDWSTAMALATLEVAQKEKRDYAYIPYNSYIMQQMVKIIPAGELDPDDLMDIAELAPSGGTNFMAPLTKALDILKMNKFKKADLLFITDGQASITPDFLTHYKKIKDEKQFYVHSVVINIGGYGSYGSVEQFSDSVTAISTIADLDDANAKEIFKLMDDKNKFDPQAPPQANP